MEPIESRLENVLAGLFDQLPALVGFSVEQLPGEPADPRDAQLEHELVLTNIETFPGSVPPGELVGEIALPLIELMDEQPEARELLRGRTFARRLH